MIDKVITICLIRIMWECKDTVKDLFIHPKIKNPNTAFEVGSIGPEMLYNLPSTPSRIR